MTLQYLRETGRARQQVALVEAYMREQGLFHEPGTPEAQYSAVLELDLDTVEPSIAGPRRPQDRVLLSSAARTFREALASRFAPGVAQPSVTPEEVPLEVEGEPVTIGHGSVVIAAITRDEYPPTHRS